MPEALTVDELGGQKHYGVMVCAMGEDGDQVAVFTHDRRRAIAAVNAFYRADGDRLHAVDVGKPAWWRAVDNCGCGEECPHPSGDLGLVEHLGGHDSCAHYGLPPCMDDVFTWVGVAVQPDDPGALPVITMEVEV